MFLRPPHLLLVMAGVASALAGQSGSAAPGAAAASPPAAQAPPAATLTPEMRGDIFMARKRYQDAIDVYQAASSKDPVLWNKTGIAYNQLPNQLDQARKAYQQAVKLKPDYAEAINNLGTVYYAKKSYRRAISYYQKAIKLAPDDPRSASFYLNLGIAFFARKQYDQCAEANQTALKLDPEVFERRGGFGTTLENRDIAERARYHYIMAKLYAKSGRGDLAMQYLRKAIEECFKEKDKLNKDPEFAGMRDLPEFKEMLDSEKCVQ
jgi:tetratricopeptide (TPR) repeat protein